MSVAIGPGRQKNLSQISTPGHAGPGCPARSAASQRVSSGAYGEAPPCSSSSPGPSFRRKRAPPYSGVAEYPGLYRNMTLKSLRPGRSAWRPGVHGCASLWLASASIYPLRGDDSKKGDTSPLCRERTLEAENRTSPAKPAFDAVHSPLAFPGESRIRSPPPLTRFGRRCAETAAQPRGSRAHKRIGPAKAGPMLKVSAKPSKVSDAAVDQDGNARMHQSMIGFQARPSANSASALTPNTTRSGRSSLGAGILPSGSSKYIALITRR